MEHGSKYTSFILIYNYFGFCIVKNYIFCTIIHILSFIIRSESLFGIFNRQIMYSKIITIYRRKNLFKYLCDICMYNM